MTVDEIIHKKTPFIIGVGNVSKHSIILADTVMGFRDRMMHPDEPLPDIDITDAIEACFQEMIQENGRGSK